MFNKNVHRSDFKEAIINSLMMFLFMIVFSIIGVFFIFTKIGGLLDLLIGVAFTVPLMYIYFYTGGQEGKREFKKLNGVSVEKAKEGGVRVPSIFKGLLYVAPYAAITVALAVLCWVTDIQWLKVVALIVYMPAAMLGKALGLITFPRSEPIKDDAGNVVATTIVGETVGSNVFIVLIVFAVIACLIFWLAYVLQIRKSRDSFNSFMSEIIENDKMRNR